VAADNRLSEHDVTSSGTARCNVLGSLLLPVIPSEESSRETGMLCDRTRGLQVQAGEGVESGLRPVNE